MAPLRWRSRKRVRRLVDRAVLSAVNAFVHVREGTARAGRNAAARETVFSRGKLELSRIKPLSDDEYDLGPDTHRVTYERRPVPVILIPPLMVRPYVYDLRAEHSLVRTLRNQGFDVFVVDFGVPDKDDRKVRLDDYVLDHLPTCIDETIRASGATQVSLLGYSFGGVFSLLYCGTNADERVKNLVVIGTPVDFEEMKSAHWAARLGAFTLGPTTAVVGNIPGEWSSLGFKMMGGARAVTRWVDFVTRLYDQEFLREFDAVNSWVNDLIPYPKEAFKQVVRELVAGNKLIRGELELGGRRCDLGNVDQSLLAFAGRGDNIAVAKAVRAVLDHVGSTDKRFVEVSGGHVAIVAGSEAPREVWQPIVEWLLPRSA